MFKQLRIINLCKIFEAFEILSEIKKYKSNYKLFETFGNLLVFVQISNKIVTNSFLINILMNVCCFTDLCLDQKNYFTDASFHN